MEIQKINVLDPKFEDRKQVAKMMRGASAIIQNRIQPVGGNVSASTTQLQYKIVNTATNWLDRRPYIHNSWTIDILATPSDTIVAPAAAAPLTVPNVDVCMAPYPFNQMLGQCSVKVNGETINSFNVSKQLGVLLKLNDDTKDTINAICPTMPENSFAKTDLALYTNSSSNATFNDASLSSIPNGAYPISATGNTYNAAFAPANPKRITYSLETYEPLFLEPFSWKAKQRDDEEALFGVSTVDIELNIDPSIVKRCVRVLKQSILSFVNAAADAVSLYLSNPQNLQMVSSELVYFTYGSPKLPMYKLPSPNFSTHIFDYYYAYQSAANPFGVPAAVGAAPAPKVMYSNGINLRNISSTTMPRMILLWADKPENAYNGNECKYFYPILRLNMDYSIGQQNILSNFTLQNLFRLSKDSGLNSSYLNFLGQAYTLQYNADGTFQTGNGAMVQLTSAPIVLVPSVSFPLPDTTTTGSNGTFTFNFEADIVNYNTSTSGAGAVVAGSCNGNDDNQKPNLNVLFVYDRYLNINLSDLSCKKEMPDINVPEVLGLERSQGVVGRDEIEPETGGAIINPYIPNYKEGGPPFYKAGGAPSLSKIYGRIKKN